MGRAPCCEKIGLKKGPWTIDEDRLLISYIQQHGHGNWRALPKKAGLLRCGKSCRLRWTNYLRPDIKRGNFTSEEEDSIIQLHETLGNRWSAIAAKLPGRTDNEIKNVWHTHLKKKLKTPKQHSISTSKQGPIAPIQSKHKNLSFTNQKGIESPVSPQQSTSGISSVTDLTVLPNTISIIEDEEMKNFPEIDESFWAEELSTGNSISISNSNSNSQTDLSGLVDELEFNFPFSPVRNQENWYNLDIDDGVDFWYDLFLRAGGQTELPDFLKTVWL